MEEQSNEEARTGESPVTEPAPPSTGPLGWYSRDYMPHFDSNEVTQHVTFRLADSLPARVVDQLEDELSKVAPDMRERERRKRLEALLDAGHGGCVLRRPGVANLVQKSLLSFDGERYRLIEWVVMPNHVHTLFQTMNGWTMRKVVASWKSFTGRRISDLTRKVGATRDQVWYREYWDRYIRDEKHFANVVAYIHNNPVKAGLVRSPKEWPWNSARVNRGRGPDEG